MDCCELLKIALYVIAGAFGVILALLAMFFGYNLKLDKRTVKLEKKNGHEQKQIDGLKKSLLAFGKGNDDLRKELEQLKTQRKV